MSRLGSNQPWAAQGDLGDGKLTMVVYTNQPSLQFYSGNWLTGTPDRQGRPYRDYDGFCLEASNCPTARTGPPSAIPGLPPGQRYRHQTRYRFIPCPRQPCRADEGAGRAATSWRPRPRWHHLNQPGGEARRRPVALIAHQPQGTAP